MDTQTLERQPGDLNLHTQKFLESSSFIQQDYQSDSSETQKTQSLSLISEKNDQLQIQDLIAFYDQLDRNLFDDRLRFDFIISEKDHYKTIDEIINQRLILAKSKLSTISPGLLVNPYRLIAIKLQKLHQYEHVLQQLDEFRIHNKINNLFPDKSLQLITPVVIQKQNQDYDVIALMERGECNLYEYSRVIPISQEQGYSIFKVILNQIANLHSINIAHRDVKPQNIFYVQNKGWILSDFGESQEYDKVESNYNIRGTLYFLMPQLKQNITKVKLIEQNLLANDLYALVVSFIMILSLEHIYDMFNEIKNLTDPLLLQCLSIRNYMDLHIFIQRINYKETPFDFNQDFFKLSNPQQFQRIDLLFIRSLLGIQKHYQYFRLETSCLQKLTKFIDSIKNESRQKINSISTILQQDPYFENFLMKDNLKRKLLFRIKNSCKKPIEQQLIILNDLSILGYIEKPIEYCKEFLKQRYDKKLQLELIKSLYKVELFQEASDQMRSFNSALKFEQLDHIQQQDYLNIINFEQQRNNRFAEINLPRQNILMMDPEKVVKSLQYSVDVIDSVIDIENSQLINGIKNQLLWFDPAIYGILEFIQVMLEKKPIYIYEQVLTHIFKLQGYALNFSFKLKILGDLGRLYILEYKSKQVKDNYQQLKQLIFKAESNQQEISFKFQVIELQIFQSQFTYKLTSKQLTQKINYLKDSLLKLNCCYFESYLRITLNNLKTLITNLFFIDWQYLPPSVFFIIEYTIGASYSDYQIKAINQVQFQYCHQQSQKILLILRNFKRCFMLVSRYQQHLSFRVKKIPKKYLFNHENFLPAFVGQFSSYQQVIYHKRRQEFLKWQYLVN